MMLACWRMMVTGSTQEKYSPEPQQASACYMQYSMAVAGPVCVSELQEAKQAPAACSCAVSSWPRAALKTQANHTVSQGVRSNKGMHRGCVVHKWGPESSYTCCKQLLQ